MVIARIVLLVYLAALTTGTHWPKLQIGTEDIPAPDKIVHWLAFGGLAALVWASGWLPGLFAFGSVVLTWTALDELSQGIRGLGRTISWLDLAAGELGVLTVIAWRIAVRPVGGEANLARVALERQSWLRGLRSWWRWVLVGGAGAIGAAVAGFPARLMTTNEEIAIVLAAAAMGAVLAALGAAEGLRRRAWAQLVAARACHACGVEAADAEPDGHGRAHCRACGGVQWIGQWHGLALDRRRLLSLLSGPLLVAVGLYAAVLALYTLTVTLHAAWPPIGRLNRMYNGLPSDLRVTIDLTILLVVAAAGAARFRADIARRVDGADRNCLTCGHDLRGMVVVSGAGRCSECGRQIVVPPSSPEEPESDR
jgi:hypothetical protein